MPERTILEPEADLAEQFDDLAQQREAGTLGMWTFLATEVLLFGGLFLGYTVYRFAYAESFHAASKHLYMSLGTINTAVLLGSSLMVALAVHAAEHGRSRSTSNYLLVAIVLGTIFLCIKGTEYYLEYRDHLVPWINWQFDEANAQHAKLFFVFYFFMTGLHAIHMIIGTCILLVLAYMARRGRFSERYNNPVEIGGLYWHFVDIVWVFLYPSFYLLNPH